MKKIFAILGVTVVALTLAFFAGRGSPADRYTNPTTADSTVSSRPHDDGVDRSSSKSMTADMNGKPVLETGKFEKRQDAVIDGAVAKKADNPNYYGITQPVRADLNPQVASVSEALREKKHPERLSPLIQPKPFDSEAYKKDSAAYLNVVEPGRCFQSKNPGKDVPKIQSLSPQFQEVAQGKSVTLRVQALAKFPVSFSSMDMGKFQNELTCITVQANESGIAEVQFFGAPGTIDEVKILASSPMTSGQIQFLIHVTK